LNLTNDFRLLAQSFYTTTSGLMTYVSD